MGRENEHFDQQMLMHDVSSDYNNNKTTRMKKHQKVNKLNFPLCVFNKTYTKRGVSKLKK